MLKLRTSAPLLEARNALGSTPADRSREIGSVTAKSNYFCNLIRGIHEIPTASRPRCHRANRCRGEDRGGIIIPDTAQEKPQQGKVIGVGPGGRDESGKLIPIEVEVGDRILFGKWSGTEVKIDGVEYLIMKESDIMGVLVEAEAKKKAA